MATKEKAIEREVGLTDDPKGGLQNFGLALGTGGGQAYVNKLPFISQKGGRLN